MPTTYTAFKTEVSVALNRGTRYDANIDAAVGDAVTWLEENYTFRYMEVVDETKTLAVGTRDIALDRRAKTIEAFRFKNDDGLWVPDRRGLPRIEPWQILSVDTGEPNGFFLLSDGKTLRVDNLADKDYPVQVVANLYSETFNVDSLGPLVNHKLLLKAATVLELNLLVKSQVLESFWADQLQLSLHAALGADGEARYAGQSHVMNPYPNVEIDTP